MHKDIHKHPTSVSCLNTWIQSVSSHPTILGSIQYFHLLLSCQVIFSFGLSRLKTRVHESCLFDLTALTKSVQELTCDSSIPPTVVPYFPFIYFFLYLPYSLFLSTRCPYKFFLSQCKQLTVAKKFISTHARTHTHTHTRTHVWQNRRQSAVINGNMSCKLRRLIWLLHQYMQLHALHDQTIITFLLESGRHKPYVIRRTQLQVILCFR